MGEGAGTGDNRLSKRAVGNVPSTHLRRGGSVVLLLALLLVLIFFGAGFALHILWIVAVVLLVLWVVGYALGRGEGASRHKFYRW